LPDETGWLAKIDVTMFTRRRHRPKYSPDDDWKPGRNLPSNSSPEWSYSSNGRHDHTALRRFTQFERLLRATQQRIPREGSAFNDPFARLRTQLATLIDSQNMDRAANGRPKRPYR